MTDAAPDFGPGEALDLDESDPGPPLDERFQARELTEADAPARSRIVCYAENGKGVHAIALDEGLALFDRCQHAQSADDDSAPLVWIDIACPGKKEESLLRDRLRFHPLAVEDCVRGRQRPKLDRYPGYYFLVLYAAAFNPRRERMALHEVHIFLGRRYLVTVHDHKVTEFGEVLARWRADTKAFHTVGALGHAIMDSIVDHYFPVVDHFADRVEEMEARIFEGSDQGGLERLLNVRREMTLFRKVLGPERDLLSTLLRRDLPFLSADLMLYFQDVHDHLLRVVEELDTLRDLLTGAMEAQLSVVSNQLNITMRLMAAWSIILMAITLVAGIYGMNFHVMPELAWPWGYPWALGLMAAIGAGLYVYFRRRNWI
ncbi:MAG: magnesium/cobalt transporter CorA [Gemmatimonadetes bacterium]|nr:magnesium/cobalt transporter CorA [Gemmatimonadota bacterium]